MRVLSLAAAAPLAQLLGEWRPAAHAAWPPAFALAAREWLRCALPGRDSHGRMMQSRSDATRHISSVILRARCDEGL